MADPPPKILVNERYNISIKSVLLATAFIFVAAFSSSNSASALEGNYTIVSGDTLTSIAETKSTTVQKLWDNNAQLENPDLIFVGDVLKLTGESPTRPLQAPQAVVVQEPSTSATFEPEAVTEAYVAPQAPVTTTSRGGYGGPNAYAWGNCTYYVKERRPDIGSYWGDASGWLYSAQAAGYSTGYTPVAGSIGVALSYGHVVYVESVNGDGSVNISEQNYNGFGVVSSRTASASEFMYIY